MKKTLQLSAWMLSLVLLFTACEKDKGFGPMVKGPKLNKTFALPVYVQDGCGEALTTDLVAGKKTVVGTVKVERDGDNELKVTYSVPETSPWYLAEMHLEVQTSLENFPLGNGNNPKIGKFSYKSKPEPFVKEFVFENIFVGEASGVYVMAHAVVAEVLGYETSLSAFEEQLPETVQFYVVRTGDSYFTSYVKTEGILQGIYEGWCIDTDHTINTGEFHLYTSEVVSSLSGALESSGIIEFPENMPKVNYILNQDYVGRMASDGNYFTYGDVQSAFWALLEDVQGTSGLGTWSQEHVDQILAEANAYGADFVPECGQDIAVILRPVDEAGQTIAQITIIRASFLDFPGVCETVCKRESAWAAGDEIGGNNWAMVFPYCVKD